MGPSTSTFSKPADTIHFKPSYLLPEAQQSSSTTSSTLQNSSFPLTSLNPWRWSSCQPESHLGTHISFPFIILNKTTIQMTSPSSAPSARKSWALILGCDLNARYTSKFNSYVNNNDHTAGWQQILLRVQFPISVRHYLHTNYGTVTPTLTASWPLGTLA